MLSAEEYVDYLIEEIRAKNFKILEERERSWGYKVTLVHYEHGRNEIDLEFEYSNKSHFKIRCPNMYIDVFGAQNHDMMYNAIMQSGLDKV